MRFVLLLLLLLSPGLASGHAMLVASDPADGAVLAEGPDRIALSFNEPVVPVALGIVDAAGVSRGGTTLAGERGVALVLPEALPPGRYVVSYRVVSADTHPVAGSLVFAVGGAPADLDLPDERADPALDAFWVRVAIAVRMLRDLALAIGCGGLAFLAHFAAPADVSLRRALVRIAWAAAGLTVLGVGVAGARVSLAATILDPAAWRIGAAISAGPAAAAVLAGIALGLSGVAPRLGLVAVAAGTALTGHAATGEPRWLVPASQALHSLAALVWIGAFVPLLRGAAHWPAATLARIGSGFSRVGLACVAGLLASGLALAATRFKLPLADYGWLVAAKLTVFACLLALAADNRWRALPRRDAAGFRRNVALELALAVGVLMLTATLSHTPPHAPDAHSGHVAARGGPSVALVRDGRIVTLSIDGARLEIYLADMAGTPFDPLEIEVELANPARGIAGLRRKATRAGAGQFHVDEPALAIPGTWRVAVGALVTDFRKETYETELRVGD